MRKKILLKILVGAVSIVLIVKILTVILFEPWLGKKLYSELNEENRNYIVRVDKVHIFIIKSGLKLEGISINPKQTVENDHGLNGEIESIDLRRINIAKAIFRHEFHISEVTVSNSDIKGNIPLAGEVIPPIVSPVKVVIGRLLFDKINLEMESSLNAKAYSIKEGVLKVYDLLIEKQDTLFPGRINLFDLKAKELVSGSSESMYSYIIRGVSYSANSNSLSIDTLFIHPNYKDYDFTSRYKFQKSRIEAVFSNIYINDFYLDGYLTSLRLKSPYIEIGKMDMNVFRDRRKEISHLNRPVLQDMLYGFPGTIQIDSIGLMNGNVTIRVHAEEANEPGSIIFNELNAKIYNVTNDTVYKTKRAFLEIKANALIMGKGKTSILLRGKLFDRNNTFTLKGTLSNMEANELNPILEKNAFIYATSGKIDKMNFSYTADNTKASGEMTMLYHGLNVTVKNKRTDDTIALRERFISFIANRRIMDSNPLAGEKVRVGIINYKRDPERFILHYCFNSILTGITSSLTKSKKKRNN